MSHLTSSHIFQLLDGTLDPGEKQRLSNHLETCEECRRELSLQRAIARGIQHQPLFSPSPRFTAAVMRRAFLYEAQSAFVHFLVQHGTMLALIIGTAIGAFTFSTMEGWDTAKQTIHNLQPEKKISDYYTVASRQCSEYFQIINEKIIDGIGSENIRLFLLTALIVLALALFDRLVIRQFMRTRL